MSEPNCFQYLRQWRSARFHSLFPWAASTLVLGWAGFLIGILVTHSVVLPCFFASLGGFGCGMVFHELRLIREEFQNPLLQAELRREHHLHSAAALHMDEGADPARALNIAEQELQHHHQKYLAELQGIESGVIPASALPVASESTS